MLLKTKTGYVQQSPWLSIANRQMELVGRYRGELGLTPVARSRISIDPSAGPEHAERLELVVTIRDPVQPLRRTLHDNPETPAARGPEDQDQARDDRC